MGKRDIVYSYDIYTTGGHCIRCVAMDRSLNKIICESCIIYNSNNEEIGDYTEIEIPNIECVDYIATIEMPNRLRSLLNETT